MGLFEQFPYANFHELNLDWILKKIKELDEKVDSIEDRILKEANAYTDQQIAGLRRDFAELEADFAVFKSDINAQFAAYTAKQDKAFADYQKLVNAHIDLLEQEIRDARAELKTMLRQANAYTDASIAMLLLQLPDIITKNIKNAKVYNLLTGKYVTIQAMFDFLCLFHAPGALTCTGVFERNNTCTEIRQYEKTCNEFITDARNFIVQH
jgi:hypothetical protein